MTKGIISNTIKRIIGCLWIIGFFGLEGCTDQVLSVYPVGRDVINLPIQNNRNNALTIAIGHQNDLAWTVAESIRRLREKEELLRMFPVTLDEKQEQDFPPAPPLVEAPLEVKISDSLNSLQSIYFDYDRSEIKKEYAQILEDCFEWIQQHPEMQIQLEGHADERGSISYNLALGEQRARAVFKFLVELGADSSQFSLISYGEEKPADQRHFDEAWSKNRRVEFNLQN